MNEEQVHAVVRDFVRNLHHEELDTPLRAESTFDELGVDSMSLVDLLFKLEREFGITIPDEDLPRIATLGDLVDHVTTATVN